MRPHPHDICRMLFLEVQKPLKTKTRWILELTVCAKKMEFQDKISFRLRMSRLRN